MLICQPARADDDATKPIAPQWLDVRQVAKSDRITFTFSATGVQSGIMRFAGDFCRTQISINGQSVAAIEPYCQTQDFDVTDALRPGDNQIELKAEPIKEAPAALALELKLTTIDGGRVSYRSDENWKVVRKSGKSSPAKPLGPVLPQLWGIGQRDISIDPFENYQQWQQAKGGGGQSPRFFLAPGFEIRQLRVAEPDEGSWVSLAVDQRGRLLIGREDKGFLRMQLAPDATSVTRVQTIASDLLECRGLIVHDDWIYASANNSKQLARFKLNDEGQITDLTALREFSGGVGHGRNDLAICDDRLLLICGDSVDPPTTNLVDWTSPLRKKVAGSFTREGSLLRSSLDGQNWDLLCAGLRNPYGVATNPETNDPFTFDADNEYDLGMPWYRPTRILQLIPGGDYGYREATSQLPPRFSDQADNAPLLLTIGRSSPTSVIFGDKFQFPRVYRNALFALDWTYGRVLAIHLSRRGATYRAAAELFLQGKPLNVTDVVAGRDGAMYLITGGRKTQSALYRVSASVLPPTPDSQLEFLETDHDDRIREYSNHAAKVFRLLQTPLGAVTDPKYLRQQLNADDPALLYVFRTALEKQPVESVQRAVFDPPARTTPLQGLLAIARALDGEQVSNVVGRLNAVDLAALPVGQKLVWLRILDLSITANREAVMSQRASLESALIAGWQASLTPRWQVAVEGTNSDYRRRAALLLQTLESSHLPRLVAQDLFSSAVQEDHVAGLMALRNHATGWEPAFREKQLEILAGMPQMVGGEGLPAFHRWLERETLPTISEDLQSRYASLKESLTRPEPLPPARPFVQKWTLDSLESIANRSDSGDPAHGKDVFQNALCARCHRFGPKGPAIGPELTHVAGRFSQRDILDSILNPSKSIAENYRGVTIHTVDGRIYTGRIVPGGDFRSETVRLTPDLLRPDQIVELDKKLIEDHEPSTHSPMPQGLLDSFSKEDISDLLAYLAGGLRSPKE